MTYTDPYPGRNGSERVTETCTKCGGSGRIEAFGNVDAGRCWDCMGAGARSVLVSSVRARLRRQAKREAERTEVDTARLDRITEARAAAVSALSACFPPFSGVIDDQGRTTTVAAEEAVIHAAEGAPVEEVIEHYRWMIGETVSGLIANRFRGRCYTCNAAVAPGAGWIGQAYDGWRTFCTTHLPQ